MKKTESENEHSEVECTTCEKRHHYSLVQRCNCDATILKISTRLAHAARLGFFYKKNVLYKFTVIIIIIIIKI